MRLQTKYYNKLWEELYLIYPNRPNIQAIVGVAGLVAGKVDLQGSARNMWNSVLSLAEKEDKLKPLLNYLLQELPNRPTFQEVSLAIDNGTAFITEISYQDYLTPSSADLPKVFMVYDPEDQKIVNEVKKQLRPLEMYDAKMKLFDMHTEPIAGQNKDEFLYTNLGESEIVLLFLTPNFMGNPDNNCDPLAYRGFQMRKLVVPLLLEECMWERITLLENIVPLPTNKEFVSESANRNKTLKEVAEGLEKVINLIKRP